jgi:multiple sugar transport system permease protein
MSRSAARLRLVFTAVPLLLMGLVLLVPALAGLLIPLTGRGHAFRAYRAVLADPMFGAALRNNLLIPLLSLGIEFAGGFALALFVTWRRSPLVEIAVVVPFALPEIVLLALARFIFLPRGYLNGALLAAGGVPVDWLRPGSWLALLTVSVVDAWHVTPVVMLILAAGLRSIPAELYEAALLDGAGRLSLFRHITLPLMAPALASALLLRGFDAMRIFSTVLVLAGAEGTPVLSTYAYQLWSDQLAPGRAMAAASLLGLLVTVLGLAGLGLGRRLSRQRGSLP